MTPQLLHVNNPKLPTPPATPQKRSLRLQSKRRLQPSTFVTSKRRALSSKSRRTSGNKAAERADRKTVEAHSTSSTDLKQFARHGGPDLSDLRGYSLDCESTESMARGGSTVASARALPEYDLAFENRARRNGVYMPNAVRGGQPQPRDIEQIRERVRQRRPSITATTPGAKNDFHNVAFRLAMATNETMVRQAVEHLLSGGSCSTDSHIHAAGNVWMNNYAPLIPKMSRHPQPDFVDSAPPDSVANVLLESLNKVIQPSQSQPHAGTLFNLDLEFKGPGGELAAATRQVMFGCAHGARGIHALESITPPAPPGHSNSGRGEAAGAATRGGGSMRGWGHGAANSSRGGRGGHVPSASSHHHEDADTLSDKAYGRTLALGATFSQTGILCLYAMHIQRCAPGQAYAEATDATPRPLREYHLVPLGSFDMSCSAQHFWDGIAAFRNMREVARDIRVEAIAAANARFASVSPLLRIDFTPSQQGDEPPPPPPSSKAAATVTGAAEQPATQAATEATGAAAQAATQAAGAAAQAATQAAGAAAQAATQAATQVTGAGAQAATQAAYGDTEPARRGGKSQASSGKRKRGDVSESVDTSATRELRHSSRLRKQGPQ